MASEKKHMDHMGKRLVTLIVIMLLGHWQEMRSIRQAALSLLRQGAVR